MESSISLEETNKIRISLGLKPLTDDKAPADDKDKTAEDNYARKREEEAKEVERKRIQDKISKVKNKRELNASPKGTTLGDADADIDDTLKWLKRSKKREKELAKKRQEELESMDKHFQGEDYTEKDLVGLKVSHDFEGLDAGEDRILTLKDSRILDNEEDELQNVEMAENERVKKNKELKIKKRDYTGYDDDEFTDGQAGVKRSILSKYDEELDGSREMGFRLGSGAPTSRQAVRTSEEQTAAVVNKSLLSIDYAKTEISDYFKEGDVGFKKPKTKKKRPSRRVAEDSETQPVDEKMDIDEKLIVPRAPNLDDNFVDDDELQAALARARRAKTMQKPKLLTAEEIAKKLTEERAREMSTNGEVIVKVEEVDGDEESGLTFDDTSEFVRAISYNPINVKRETRDVKQPSTTTAATEDDPMNGQDETMEELEAGELPVKEEEDEEAMLNALESAIQSAEAEEAKVKLENGDDGVGTSAEQTFGSGMAATSNILRQQGVLAAPSSDQREREKVQRQRDFWLAEHRAKVALREPERARAHGERKDQAQREYENRLREQQEARESLDAFKDYKPDVNIVYHDEFGRELTPKEAWKMLSHRFHGKTSGKAKTEKRLKKIAEERKKEAMASGDIPLSMNKAFQMRQEKAGQAHFVLSVGNRGAVPQAAEFLDPPTLSKGKTAKNKKKESSKVSTVNAPAVDMTSFTVSAPPRPMSASPAPSAGTPLSFRNGDSPAPTAMMKSSFFQVHEPVSGSGTPVTNMSDRTKVAFGLKRKATEDIKGTPPKKR